MNKKVVIAAVCALIGIIFLGTISVVLSGQMTGALDTENTQGTEVVGTEEIIETETTETEMADEEVVTLFPVKMTASSLEKDLKWIERIFVK